MSRWNAPGTKWKNTCWYGMLTEPLFLCLEQALILLDKFFDLPGHTKNLAPLLFVQGISGTTINP